MIQFTDEQIQGMTAEEKEMLNNLTQRHKAQVLDEEQKRMKEYIKKHFDKEKENEEYAKWMESQLDTAAPKPTTQYF